MSNIPVLALKITLARLIHMFSQDQSSGGLLSQMTHILETAVLDSVLFSSLTKTHNCRLIVAKIWTGNLKSEPI